MALLLRYTEVWVSRLEGFWPDLGECARCSNSLSGQVRVNPGSEGAFCATCDPDQVQVFALGSEAVKLVYRILRTSPSDTLKHRSEARPLLELGRLNAALLSYHLEHDFTFDRQVVS